MRKRALLSVVLASLGGALWAAPAAAQLQEIQIVDTPPSFSPRKPAPLPAGWFFHWTWPAGGSQDHNVRQDDRLFRSGAPGDLTDYPDGYGIQASAGRFNYYCDVHGAQGLNGQSGRISVRPLSKDAPVGLPFRVAWANSGTETGDRFDVRFRVGDGRWRDWREDTRKFSGVFGRNDKPVKVRAGRQYAFRARSQKGPNDGKVSDWSPKLKVET